LVTVDDAHLLDGVSLGVLATVADRVRLLLAVDTERPWPPELGPLLSRATVVRPEPLEPDRIAALAHDHLGAPLDQASLRRLVAASGGRPGHVHRVLAAAEETLIVTDGLSRLPRRVGGLPPLVSWARSRLDGCSTAAGVAFRLAAGDPELTATELVRLTSAAALDELATQRLAIVRGGSAPPELPDPLLRLVVRDGIGPPYDAADARHARAVLAADVDPGRVARWAVRAGERPTRVGLTSALRSALHAGRLTTALALVEAAGPGIENDGQLLVLCGEALAASGRVEEALALAVRAAGHDDPRVAGPARLLAADLRFFRCGDIAGALEMLEQPGPVDPSIERELRALTRLIRSATSAPTCAEAAPQTPPAAAEPGREQPPSPYAQLVAGLFGVLRGSLPEEHPVVPPERTVPALLVPRMHANARMHALYLGRISDGLRAAERHVERALATERPGALGLALTGLAEAQQLAGRLQQAEAAIREARLHLEEDDESGSLAPTIAGHATILAELGDLERAAAVLAHAEQLPAAFDLRVHLVGAGARIRILAAHDPAAAVDLAREVLEVGTATGHLTWAVLAAQHAVRCGLGAEIADQLTQAVSGIHGDLFPAVARLARATRDRDAAAARAAGDALAGCGAARLAAEAWLAAAGLEPDPRAAASDQHRAHVALAPLGPPNAAPGAKVEQLTPRQQQVARLAAAGVTSPEIADRLHLSVRTVDNHLRSAYRKLGVAGRAQLSEIVLS
jgi:DNA-binding CsgD family transcriptional regulator